MNAHWTESGTKRYRELIREQMIAGCRWLNILAMTLFPAFAVLDYFAHPDHYRELFVIRFSTTFIYLCLYPFLNRKTYRLDPYYVSLLVLSSAALSITLMCNVLDGFTSPYYAGVNLVILAAILVLPMPAQKMGVVVSSVIGIYLIGIFAHQGFRPGQFAPFLNNMYFLLATGIIGVVAAHLMEQVRVQSFDRYLQLEKAQADLKRSRDLLQMELKSEQGNVEVLIQEITLRKTELEQALNLREEFISLASHELNTPLTSLSLQTDVAKHRMLENNMQPEHFQRLITHYDAQLKRLIRIVSDMLDISRIESGKLDLERGQVDLEVLTRDLVERTSQRLQKDGQTIQIECNEKIIGNWDSFRIEQVILNLMTNAIKYGNSKPVIIKLEKTPAEAIIRVIDQGIGISPEDQKRIFEKFERAVHPTSYSGLGLGLYISLQIIRARRRSDLAKEHSRLGIRI